MQNLLGFMKLKAAMITAPATTSYCYTSCRLMHSNEENPVCITKLYFKLKKASFIRKFCATANIS